MKVHSAEQETGNNTTVRRRMKTNKVYEFLDRHLVGKVSPSDFTEEWHKKFVQHPSWCDADICLQQINQGNAVGNRIALYSRSLFQQLLFSLGQFVQTWPRTILVVGMIVLLACCFGLKDVHIETDLVKLWVEQDGRLEEELSYLGRTRQKYSEMKSRHTRSAPGSQPVVPTNANPAKPTQSAPELPVENTFGGGFQVIIQTTEIPNADILTRENLLTHVRMLEEIAQYNVTMFGETWFLSDICFKPPPPASTADSIGALVEEMIAQIIPCVWITPIDCFWEGSKPLGPFPPINLDIAGSFLPSLPKSALSWKNLNPELLLQDAKSLVNVGMVADLFDRAGVGAAYQDRYCIDPLDFECPKSSPNYFDRCAAFDQFIAWNKNLPRDQATVLKEDPPTALQMMERVNAVLNRPKRLNLENKTTSTSPKQNKVDDTDYYENDDDATTTTENPGEKLQQARLKECKKYEKSFTNWLRANEDKWDEFMTKVTMPSHPSYKLMLTGGCKGFGKNIMNWPEDLIVGGIKRSKDDRSILHAEALQTVFLVASAGDVYNRFINNRRKPNLNRASFSPGHAAALIAAWQRNFTKSIYEHRLNKPEKNIRVIHPLASTSIQDMLTEFSQFQFNVIFIGYILMIIYAGWSQVEWDGFWFSTKSSCFLAIVGVLVVTYASIAGLGLSTLFGIHFNAATTQIVPFLTLGLGIDDMFLILHNYNGVLESVHSNEIAVLLKETGMSILITSINNILAFLTGTILPIPALRSFCGQTAILLTANVICIILIYPAFIALDINRRKAGYRDMSLASCYPISPAKEPKNKKGQGKNQLMKSESLQSGGIVLQKMTGVFDSNSVAKPSQHNSSPSNNHSATEYKLYTLEGFLHIIYIPFITKPSVKAGILILCMAMFFFGCIGLYRSRIGLELADVLPENTAPAAFLKARERYFSFYPMFIVTRGEADIPKQQALIEKFRREIANSDFVIKVHGNPEPYWIQFMRSWLNSLQTELDKATAAGLIPTDDTSKLAKEATLKNYTINDEFLIARQLLCSSGKQFDCSNKVGLRLFDRTTGIINPEGFYNYLTAWFYQDNMMYYVSQAAFFPTPPPWRFSSGSVDKLVPPSEPLLYSQIPFYLNGLTDTPAIVDMIKEIRAICDKYSAQGLPIFPSGIPFTFWEQYLQLTFYLVCAVLIIGVAVLLVISLIIFNPWAAAMVAIIVVSMTVELAGFMGLFGVKLNPISAVTLITAVGIGVEFTAHVVLAFLTSLGTRDERMISCLEHMFIPVIHGGLSTLLGIIMLAFSEFDFVVKYFFVVMSALIIIGLINGLALLPVLLNLIGPPCEITPVNGGNMLYLIDESGNIPMSSPSTTEKAINEKAKTEQQVRSGNSPDTYDESSSEDGQPHQYHDSLSTLNEVSGEDSAKNTSGNLTDNTLSVQRF